MAHIAQNMAHMAHMGHMAHMAHMAHMGHMPQMGHMGHMSHGSHGLAHISHMAHMADIGHMAHMAQDPWQLELELELIQSHMAQKPVLRESPIKVAIPPKCAPMSPMLPRCLSFYRTRAPIVRTSIPHCGEWGARQHNGIFQSYSTQARALHLQRELPGHA